MTSGSESETLMFKDPQGNILSEREIQMAREGYKEGEGGSFEQYLKDTWFKAPVDDPKEAGNIGSNAMKGVTFAGLMKEHVRWTAHYLENTRGKSKELSKSEILKGLDDNMRRWAQLIHERLGINWDDANRWYTGPFEKHTALVMQFIDEYNNSAIANAENASLLKGQVNAIADYWHRVMKWDRIKAREYWKTHIEKTAAYVNAHFAEKEYVGLEEAIKQGKTEYDDALKEAIDQGKTEYGAALNEAIDQGESVGSAIDAMARHIGSEFFDDMLGGEDDSAVEALDEESDSDEDYSSESSGVREKLGHLRIIESKRRSRRPVIESKRWSRNRVINGPVIESKRRSQKNDLESKRTDLESLPVIESKRHPPIHVKNELGPLSENDNIASKPLNGLSFLERLGLKEECCIEAPLERTEHKPAPFGIREEAIIASSANRIPQYVAEFDDKSLYELIMSEESRTDLIEQLNDVVDQFENGDARVSQYEHHLLNHDKILQMQGNDKIRFVVAVKQFTDFCNTFKDNHKKLSMFAKIADRAPLVGAIFGTAGAIQSYLSTFAELSESPEEAGRTTIVDFTPLARDIIKSLTKKNARSNSLAFIMTGVSYLKEVKRRVALDVSLGDSVNIFMKPALEKVQSLPINTMLNKEPIGAVIEEFKRSRLKRALISTVKGISKGRDDVNDIIAEAKAKATRQAREIMLDLGFKTKAEGIAKIDPKHKYTAVSFAAMAIIIIEHAYTSNFASPEMKKNGTIYREVFEALNPLILK